LANKIFKNISLYADTETRDTKYQKNCIKRIYNDIYEIKEKLESRRFFSKSQIDERLKEQENLCGICNLEIKSFQSYEGDHIVPYSNGGQTTMENLRVVHQTCHRGIPNLA
jgi:5-methylcytosine-specific restriction endonuclease McrA